MTRFTEVLGALKHLGIRHLRDDALYVPELEQGPNAHFKRLQACAREGFRLSMICYDRLNPHAYTPPEALPRIFDLCDGGVAQFEGSNEPPLDGGGGEARRLSAQHQAALHRVMRNTPRLDGIPLLGPSYVQGSCDVALAQADLCDFGNAHTYPGMEHPETSGAGALPALVGRSRRIFRGLPFMATETGYHCALQTKGSFLPVPHAARTRYLPRLLLWHVMHGIWRSYVYEAISSFAPDRANPESAFGLLDFDCRPTGAFHALANLLRLTGPGGQAATPLAAAALPSAPDLHSLLIDRGAKGPLLAVWLGLPCAERGNVEATVPTERSVALRLSGTARAIRAHRFLDDGSIATREHPIAEQGAAIPVSDQLTLFELPA